jgi:hypothetical protein
MSSNSSPTTRETETTSQPLVVYLDQNMWIDLARAAGAPQNHPRDREILELLCAKTEAGGIRLPLTTTNLYETHKVSDPALRASIAYTQACLSGAEFFRGRRRRLQIEIARVLSAIYELSWTEPDPNWVFSRLFFEADFELGDPRLSLDISAPLVAAARRNPQVALFDYLAHIDETVRAGAVARFEAGSDALRANIEARRAEHRAESLSMRRRIYSVLLVLDDQQEMIAVADQLGLPWRCFEDNNGAAMRRVARETPAFIIEREIGLKLEALARPIHVNDMRDMRNFVTAVPYADVILAEKFFTTLARQAGLERRFGVRLGTCLEDLRSLI